MPRSGKASFGKRAPQPDAGDRRQAGRASTYKNAQITLSDHTEVDCIARNVSADGCLIAFIGAEHLPDLLTIRLDPTKDLRPAQVVWRAQGEAGLKFFKST